MKTLFTFLWTILFVVQAQAIELRVIGGGRLFNADEMNKQLTNQSLKEIFLLGQAGAEASWEIAPSFDLGVRYLSRTVRVNSASGGGSDYADLKMTTLAPVARFIALNTVARIDAFAGFSYVLGSTLETSVSGVVSTYGKKGVIAPFVGGSFGFTIGPVFLVGEGGVEFLKLTGLERSATASPTLDTMDLEGLFINAALGARF